MAQGYGSYDPRVWFIREAGYGGGEGTDPASPTALTAGSTHVPFNNVDGGVGLKVPSPEVELKKIIGNIYPHVLSGGMAPQTMSVTTLYHAPFILSEIFSDVTIGAWGAGTATIDMTALTADWSAAQDSIAIHFHNEDAAGVNNVDWDFYGGVLTSYSWEISDANGPSANIMESFDVSYSFAQENVVVMNPAPTFHNNGFAYWNTDILDASRGQTIEVPASDCTFTADAGFNAGVNWQRVNFTIETPRAQELTNGTGHATQTWRDGLNISVEVEGILKSATLYAEAVKSWYDRPVADCSLSWTKGSTTETLTCTKMFIDDMKEITASPDDDIPSKITCVFKPTSDSALTFAGVYDDVNTPDPSAYF